MDVSEPPGDLGRCARGRRVGRAGGVLVGWPVAEGLGDPVRIAGVLGGVGPAAFLLPEVVEAGPLGARAPAVGAGELLSERDVAGGRGDRAGPAGGGLGLVSQ